ncbi:hypothetical protein SEA_CHIVEY_38 [Microbacterium phage Chivey]|nr:hypothetical protein SEA_CHIVEY_38 [Microbacterium phage Chivey]QPX61882.1 hypothetical protein SEA_DANNYDE_38 [Microbacterium phage DannyDe]
MDIRSQAIANIEEHYTGENADLGAALVKLFRNSKTVVRIEGTDTGVRITEDGANR